MHVMFPTRDHPHVIWYEWKTFQNEFSPFLVEQVVDRREIEMPKWYVPLARGAAIASSYLLRRSGYRPGSCRARGWIKPNCNILWKDIGLDSLIVRRVGSQHLWAIERNGSPGRPHNHANKTLVHNFGSTPIFTRTFQAATYIAEFCYWNDPPAGLRWIDECPDLMQLAIDFYRKRRIVEAVIPSTRLPRGSRK